MAKSKISAPVGFNPSVVKHNPKPKKDSETSAEFNPKNAPVAEKPVTDYKHYFYNPYFRAWYSSDDGLAWYKTEQTQQETKPNKPDSMHISGFSLDLIPTGRFLTVEWVNKYGTVSRYNGRTGVKKYYIKKTGHPIDHNRFFVLWVRRGSIKFDGVVLIDKRSILRVVADGVVVYSNPDSKYQKAV